MAGAPTATRIAIAGASATVVSQTPAVTAWALRYFRPWWDSADVSPPASGDAADGPIIVAEVDPRRYTDLAQHTITSRHEDSSYAKAPVLLARSDHGAAEALSPTERLVYRTEPGSGRILIVGADQLLISLAAARLARESVRALLQAEGWALLHASAVTRRGRALLALGRKGAGKTTAALTLAHRCGWELLANDRVFVRDDTDGVRILPWPAAAAIGLGLLDALDLYDSARDRVRAGDQLHPTQDARVTAALHAGHRVSPRGPDGRELKTQVFPDQLATWFGLRLATEGCAVALLFPTVTLGVIPTAEQRCRGLAAVDFFTAQTEDRYPDIFGLSLVDSTAHDNACAVIGEHLAHLPHHTVTLGHDIAANTALLRTITSWI